MSTERAKVLAFEKPAADYEECGVCGFDHTYDAWSLSILRHIVEAHKNEVTHRNGPTSIPKG